MRGGSHPSLEGATTSPPDRIATRVADAHAQARRTLAASGVFAVASPVAAVVPHDTGPWLPLHLLLVGALLAAISGATQLLAVSWSTAPAPSDPLAIGQRWCIVIGAIAVAGGRELDAPAITGTGAAVVGVGLALLAVILLGVRRDAATDRFAPAIETYLAAVACGILGVGLGAAVAAGDPADWWVRLRGAHLALNVFGLVGLVIAGTLPFFVATQARMKMSSRATPARLRAGGGALLAATALTALGHLLERPGLAGIGLLAYAFGLLAVVATLPRPRRRQLDWAGPRLVQLATGLGWWLAATALLALHELADAGPGEVPALRALAVGGFAQILVASLAYFGPVLRAGGHRRLAAGFATTRSWFGLAAGNVAAALLLADREAAAVVVLAAWAFDTAARAARLALGGDAR